MSDILIKGVEMPPIGTYEASIDVTKSNGKTAISVYLRDENDSRRFSVRVYEAVHVPPHGRLIDADALIADIRANSESYFADDFAHEWVDVAPTVIDAEGNAE